MSINTMVHGPFSRVSISRHLHCVTLYIKTQNGTVDLFFDDLDELDKFNRYVGELIGQMNTRNQDKIIGDTHLIDDYREAKGR